MFNYSTSVPFVSAALIVLVCLFASGKFAIDLNEQPCEFLIAGVFPPKSFLGTGGCAVFDTPFDQCHTAPV